MATVQTWLDRWVKDERNVPRSTSRYPDDVDRRPGPESPNSEDRGAAATGEGSGAGISAAGGDSPPWFAALSSFRHRTRGRREFHGLSLADLQALGGASEERSAGCLSIREDLPSADYLAVPFVRRAWRLLWLLDDGGGVRFEFGRSPTEDDATSPPALQAITFDWRLARCLDMDPRTAHVNLRRLLQILMATEFLDERDEHGLSARSYDLIRHGRVGAFYKALLLRLFNRYPWGLHDGLPPLTFIQYNALFMSWVLTRAGERGITPEELQRPLAVMAGHLVLDSDEISWSEDAHLVARSVEERFLRRLARMLGLCEVASERGESRDAADSGGSARYRATPFAARVLRWHV
ncbi:MAG: hypothetical protein WD492_16040 [Alkalispirochaeta sp.]